MSIRVRFPHMALNAEGVPGTHYQMWNTWEVARSETTDHIIEWTANVAKSDSPTGKLGAVVMNCHATSWGLKLGTGITWKDSPKFAPWKGLVDYIWIIACKTAAVDRGNLFCSDLAKQTGAYVLASSNSQYDGTIWPINNLACGEIDDWEGLVLRYSPDGSATATNY